MNPYNVKEGVFMNLNNLIIKEINSLVEKSKKTTKYKKPLVGFADANHPDFKDLKNIAASNHYLPSDLLIDGVSVVSFFLPFTEELVAINKNHHYISKEWAIAYVETNNFIDEIIVDIGVFLGTRGIKCSSNPARESFDKNMLMHRWSQRHVARICGLGNFGINNMLITKSGCAGRYGSFVINVPLEYDAPCVEDYCLYKRNGSCRTCVDACPTEALKVEGFDRHKCYAWLKETDNYYSDLDECQVCGKCITVPCAFRIP